MKGEFTDMKMEYKKPELGIARFSTEDVVKTSGFDGISMTEEAMKGTSVGNNYEKSSLSGFTKAIF